MDFGGKSRRMIFWLPDRLLPEKSDISVSTTDGRNCREWSRWRNGEKPYLEYLDSYDDRDSAEYAFIYVDDDDIPELVVYSGWALNSRVLTFHDNKVNDLETYRFTIRYVEKEGLLVNSGSHMWEGFENFYALRGGQWEQIGSGKFYELDELGNEGLFFEWEEEKVTEEEYDQRGNSIFPAEREKLPAYLYTFDELYFILGGE